MSRITWYHEHSQHRRIMWQILLREQSELEKILTNRDCGLYRDLRAIKLYNGMSERRNMIFIDSKWPTGISNYRLVASCKTHRERNIFDDIENCIKMKMKWYTKSDKFTLTCYFLNIYWRLLIESFSSSYQILQVFLMC
jgi:hypothetical protein